MTFSLSTLTSRRYCLLSCIALRPANASPWRPGIECNDNNTVNNINSHNYNNNTHNYNNNIHNYNNNNNNNNNTHNYNNNNNNTHNNNNNKKNYPDHRLDILINSTRLYSANQWDRRVKSVSLDHRQLRSAIVSSHLPEKANA
ncbi:hypothetical protein PoB_007716600 [Plakobranchus ocellatus]|uniref:Uncharacterized protein n=1 Tax=Plakobranchus ocellatus TaxID=259542 RepID=A0AAV4E2W8_9GAST|nr:hypothetical protein PoB_007716600 [Plakobranchus ocellatus]